MAIEKDKLIDMFTKMVYIRAFEEKSIQQAMEGEISGHIHVCIGQEATAVGVMAALEPSDRILGTHRGHGQCIAKGSDVKYMMAELFGRKTGYCKGKGGSLHIANVDVGMLGANGIVGGGLPIACGSALTSKIKGTSEVTVSFFGDGAANQGTFHESLNLASIWNLPVVFVCENNLYAQSTSQRFHMNVEDVSARASGYNIPGVTADGMDVLAVYEVAKAAVDSARKGEGPTLIEYKTYRYHGHYIGDPGAGYRTDEELNQWKERDPIKSFRKTLLDENIPEDELDAIVKRAEEDVDEAIQFSKDSPYPDVEETFTDVYFSI